jgi:hypothetical protein
MYKLFLDDERIPSDVTWIVMHDGPWVIVRSQPEFEAYVLAHGMPDVISFDNDLGTGMGEGRFCARWLVEQLLDGIVVFNPAFAFTVHSKNTVAAEWITQYLDQYLDFRK